MSKRIVTFSCDDCARVHGSPGEADDCARRDATERERSEVHELWRAIEDESWRFTREDVARFRMIVDEITRRT